MLKVEMEPIEGLEVIVSECDRLKNIVTEMILLVKFERRRSGFRASFSRECGRYGAP